MNPCARTGFKPEDSVAGKLGVRTGVDPWVRLGVRLRDRLEVKDGVKLWEKSEEKLWFRLCVSPAIISWV